MNAFRGLTTLTAVLGTVGIMSVQAVPLELSVSQSAAGAAPVLAGAAAGARAWNLPLAFELADGRSPQGADYVARGDGYTVFLGSGGALIGLRGSSALDPDAPSSVRPIGRTSAAGRGVESATRWHWVQLRLVGAETDRPGTGEFPLPGQVHRLQGRDPQGWQTGQVHQGRVRYSELYPGVDVVFYGRGRELEYDFVVAPGASADQVRLAFDGSQAPVLEADGSLRLETPVGPLIQRRPVAYQDLPTGRVGVAAAYRVESDGLVGLDLGEYDPRLPLVIDPVLSYSTYLGGASFDQCWDVVADETGSVWVVGEIESPVLTGMRLLSTNAFQTNYQGGLPGVAGDAFVAKLNPLGTAYEWFTYLGGVDLDSAFAVALTADKEPVVVGFTTSTNFPITTGAFQTELRGLTNEFTGRLPLAGFVTRLKADGSGLVASTILSGNGEDQVIDVALGAEGRIHVGGITSSTNLPLPGTGPQSVLAGGTDGFLAVFDPTLSTMLGGSFVGGTLRDSIEGVVVGLDGVTHAVGITGSTNLPLLHPIQSQLRGGSDAYAVGARLLEGTWVYGTYLGGSGDDFAYRAALGSGGTLWMVGASRSTNFPLAQPLLSTNAGGSDGILTRLSADGRTLEFSTRLGGEAADSLWDVAVDAGGTVHFAGESLSTRFTGVTTNALQATNAGNADLVVGWLAPDGTVTSTFFGAPGDEIAYGLSVDPAGNTYLAGRARSLNFPISSTNVAQAVHGGGSADGFVLRLSREPALEAALVDGMLHISWPAPAPGFRLETSSGPGPGPWQPFEGATPVDSGRHVVRLPSDSTNSLFRLRWVE